MAEITSTVNYDVQMYVDFKDGRHSIYAEPAGITVYADTKQEAIDRAHEALTFFFDTIAEHKGVAGVRAYLDRHNVPHTLIEGAEERPIRISRHTQFAMTSNV